VNSCYIKAQITHHGIEVFESLTSVIVFLRIFNNIYLKVCSICIEWSPVLERTHLWMAYCIVIFYTIQ